MLSQLWRIAAPCLACGLLFAARASAHDPFEITTDAHLDAGGLNVHTTLSLDSAVRLCLPKAAPARRLVRSDFEGFRRELERCARDYYAVTSGGQSLSVRSLSLSLSPEDDLEVRAVHDRPVHGPLTFDALRLKELPEAGGIVLTVTGQRSFLGQKLLRRGDARLELPITPEGEAIGAPSWPPSSSPSASPAASSTPLPAAVPRAAEHWQGWPFLLALFVSVAAFAALRRRR
ncbi:MAG TPA: hypothetical protein VFK05_14010 [Polyangiaceae bacterium]|nr:hypothetical protein [Polyangiaceae bacterium]